MSYPSPAVRAAVSAIAIACRENRDPDEIAELRAALAEAKIEQQIAENLGRLGLPRVFRTGDLRLIMLLPACSDNRRASLAEFCTRVLNEGASDCTGSRCSGQYPRGPSFSSGRLCGARVRLSVRH